MPMYESLAMKRRYRCGGDEIHMTFSKRLPARTHKAASGQISMLNAIRHGVPHRLMWGTSALASCCMSESVVTAAMSIKIKTEHMTARCRYVWPCTS
jgi:hypothetical protein